MSRCIFVHVALQAAIVQYNTPSWGARSGVAMEHRANRSKRLKTDTRQKLCFSGLDNTQSVMRQGIERANQKG